METKKVFVSKKAIAATVIIIFLIFALIISNLAVYLVSSNNYKTLLNQKDLLRIELAEVRKEKEVVQGEFQLKGEKLDSSSKIIDRYLISVHETDTFRIYYPSKKRFFDENSYSLNTNGEEFNLVYKENRSFSTIIPTLALSLNIAESNDDGKDPTSEICKGIAQSSAKELKGTELFNLPIVTNKYYGCGFEILIKGGTDKNGSVNKANTLINVRTISKKGIVGKNKIYTLTSIESNVYMESTRNDKRYYIGIFPSLFELK